MGSSRNNDADNVGGAAANDAAPQSGADVSTPSKDVLLVGGPSEDGQGLQVLRFKDDEVQPGEIRTVREGQPIVGDYVRLRPRQEHERLFDVEVLARGPSVKEPAKTAETSTAKKGPALVNSEAYRSGWEGVFGRPRRDEDLN